MKRYLEYENNPEIFLQKYKSEQDHLCEKIKAAVNMLRKVDYSDEILRLASEISVSLGVDGHRADIAMIKTAVTNAAYEAL